MSTGLVSGAGRNYGWTVAPGGKRLSRQGPELGIFYELTEVVTVDAIDKVLQPLKESEER